MCARPAATPSRPRPIAEVLRAHTDSLMAIPGVVGVGIGECSGRPCIKVLVAARTPELRHRVPTDLEGYAVEIQVTGRFEARDTS